MKNIIILGAGRTGSSFLAGLISHKRFFINKDKIPHREGYPDGDYENPDLISLNKRILYKSGYDFSVAVPGKIPDIQKIRQLSKNDPSNLYQNFINQCEDNKPWLWKDPRLCYTIYFWDHFIKKNEIKFIRITRDPYLVFRSHSKYQIKDSKKNIIENYHAQNNYAAEYLNYYKINALTIDYSELQNYAIIDKLNNYLNIDITVDDYNFIKKDSISKKESEIKFFFRYLLGLTSIKLKKYLISR